ncbi:MAG: UDP-N-acetylglucosamine 1-carboxyvinyltransferase [Oligoflexia bacterium]|nr:UDP-N-acetylglucosamine 1-carboxyvinyltransferase [Oligoflexia bacterium]
MDKLIIVGPAKLSGSVRVSSSKNASLPILVASLLSTRPVTLKNLPRLRDIETMLKLLRNLGAVVTQDERGTTIDSANLSTFSATYELVKTMRASFLVLGPLLSRFGEGKVSLPGGCAIGVRAIDIHLDGLAKMGAKIELNAGHVQAKIDSDDRRLHGGEIHLSFPSVGATENLMMAATLAKGTTIIKNAAREPEVEDLGNFINFLGGKVKGAGESEVIIEGVDYLDCASSGQREYEVIPDRIEAATYIIAAAMTGSTLEVVNVISRHLDTVIAVLRDMGVNLELDEENNLVRVLPSNELKGMHVDTAPYPGFPTDVQAQLMALAMVAKTPSVITEHIFENRFMHVPELNRLGTNIFLRGNSAFISGNYKLKGAPIMCTDLRASAALVLAALVAEGRSDISRIYHLDRGYEGLDSKLKSLGVNIERAKNGL